MNAAETADLLERTAAAVRAGTVTPPLVDMQFIVTAEPDQDAALTATAALYPGFRWQDHLSESELLGPHIHVHGRSGRVHVTVSGRADRVNAATVAGLTAERVTA